MKTFIIFLLLLVGAKGLLLNPNHTHGASIEERLDLLEKKLADEKRQRYILQIEYDQEKERIAQLEHQQDTMNETDQKLFKDISTQFRGVLLSINTLETNFGVDNQNLVDALKTVQTKLANLTLNQSEIVNIQRHFQEKEKVLSSTIDAVKHNQSTDRERLSHLKANLTSLAESQRTLESTVNANVNKQNRLQTQISTIKESVLFLAIPKLVPYYFIFRGSNITSQVEPTATPRTIIKFPVAKINVGGGYDNNTGVFTCPSDGYYVFHWSITSTESNKRCFSEIIKNGARVIGNEVGGNQATFHMNRNDRAWIKATSDCIIVSYHSSFSGFKII